MLPEGDKISDLTRPHGSRFRDALAIVNPGACNPSGIAQSIIDACREVREHEPKVGIAQDPAIRLMVYQLAHLLGVAGAQYDVVHYMADEVACKEFGLFRAVRLAVVSVTGRIWSARSGA